MLGVRSAQRVGCWPSGSPGYLDYVATLGLLLWLPGLSCGDSYFETKSIIPSYGCHQGQVGRDSVAPMSLVATRVCCSASLATKSATARSTNSARRILIGRLEGGVGD